MTSDELAELRGLYERAVNKQIRSQFAARAFLHAAPALLDAAAQKVGFEVEVESLKRSVEVLAERVTASAERVGRLEEENRKLRQALQPFASPPLYVFDGFPSDRYVPSPQPEHWIGGGWFTAGEFDRARALLAEPASGGVR